MVKVQDAPQKGHAKQRLAACAPVPLVQQACLLLLQGICLLPLFVFCYYMYKWEREDLVPIRYGPFILSQLWAKWAERWAGSPYVQQLLRQHEQWLVPPGRCSGFAVAAHQD